VGERERKSLYIIEVERGIEPISEGEGERGE